MKVPRRTPLYPLALLLAMLLAVPRAVFAGDEYSPLRDRNVFRHHDNAYQKIALTFDDGPHPVYTAQILDILREHGAFATFFVIGQNVCYGSELLCRMSAEGHEIGNHTYAHRSLYHLDAETLRAEILRGEDAVADCTDVRTQLFRPPEGFCSAEISDAAAALDYSVILWNIDTCDWQHRAADDIVKDVLDTVKSGDIILMHDYVGGVSHTVEAVRALVPALQARGFQLVTVSELIGSN